MSLMRSQSSSVERDADRNLDISQGYQDMEEVYNDALTVVDVSSLQVQLRCEKASMLKVTTL